jgi:hypothetical protein
MDAPSEPVRLTVDRSRKRLEVEFVCGRVVSKPLTGTGAEHEGQIARTDFDPASGELVVAFDWGDAVVLQLEPRPDPAPVVYLDQNHWVKLAQLERSPHKVEAYREAYERLTELARSSAVALPLSSAHSFETAKKDGRQRRELAITMLRLSRGLQMRNPLKVKREEILAALSALRPGAAFVPRPVFTLDPEALFSSNDWLGEQTADRELHSRLTWATALAEVFVEDERVDDPLAREKAERWVSTYKEIGERLGSEDASREQKRAAATAATIADFSGDLAEAAAVLRLDAATWKDWLRGSEANIAAMPATGRVAEITAARLADANYPWHPHDLSDMHFLATAAGYADHVLAERATAHDLRQAQRRVSPGARISSTPEELVESLG